MGFFCTYVMNINYIKEAIEPDVEKLGYKVWGLELFGRHSNQTLRVYIDNEKGISLEDCEVVSKHISKVLDVENNFSEKYSLEVSSPGLDRKFFHNNQYEDFIGGNIKVTFFDDKEKKTKKGLLKDVSEDGIELVTENLEMTVRFSSIIRANLII